MKNLEYSYNKIGNVSDAMKNDILEKYYDVVKNFNGVETLKFLRKEYKLNKPLNRGTETYWQLRLWDKKDYFKKMQNYKNNLKFESPFNYLTWVNRGYTEDEAKYKSNSFRPIRKEYWIERGYDECEAEILAIGKKKSNDLKASLKRKDMSTEEIMKSSVRRKEYWIERGYTEDEAKLKVSEVQSTFSKEKCILKYGDKEGIKVWEDRQEKWQNTLKSKDSSVIDDINSRKSAINIKSMRSSGISDTEIRKILGKRNITLFDTVADLSEYITNMFMKSRYINNLSSIEIVNKIGNCKFDYLNISDSCKFVDDLRIDDNSVKFKTKYGYIKRINEGLLRSNYEIYFHSKLLQHGIENFEVDNSYPGSNFRFDFKIGDLYIEICPMYDQINQDKYTKKMDKKRELFNCILLKSYDDIDNFFKYYNLCK